MIPMVKLPDLCREKLVEANISTLLVKTPKTSPNMVSKKAKASSMQRFVVSHRVMPEKVHSSPMLEDIPQMTGRCMTSKIDDDLAEDLMLDHDLSLSILRSRLTKLQVHADVISVMLNNIESLTIDLFSCLLSILFGLLNSKTERHINVSLEMLLKLVVVFGSAITFTISAPPVVGVNLHAEKRIESFNQCHVHLQKIHRSLPNVIRLIWLEIHGLSLGTWGSNAYKKVANYFEKFLFFDSDIESCMGMGRVGSWNILINDDIESMDSEDGHFDEECKFVNVAEKPLEYLDDILQPLEKNLNLCPSTIMGKDPNFFVKSNIWCGDNYVIVNGKWKNLTEDYYFINVYGPQHQPEKANLWNFLHLFIQDHHGMVILFGDLNEVRDISERYGSLFSSGDAAIFNPFIQDANLFDLPMGDDVLEAHSDIYITILDKLWSDHNSILLHCNKTDFCPIPFCIFHSWFDRADFVDVVKQAWANLTNGEGGHNTAFHIKIKGLKQHLKQWYSQIKISDNSRKKDVTDSLLTIEDLIDSGNATNDNRAQRVTKLHELDNLEKLESLDLIHKARIKWDVEGDKNSKYFHGTNYAFITLIPKIPNPLFIKDYMPISLIGIQYKIIAKILANRLSKVIDSLVSQEQSDFISGRQILDGPLILSEIIDWYKKQKKMLFKVDFEKAFDSVSWRYLDHVMCMIGFGIKWQNWIKSCLYSSRTSILINGSPTLEFSLKRGLKQGDPLSPFLFIIIMEGLHIALTDVMAANLFHGVNVGSSSLRLSHLFYADDVIIMSEWDKRDMENIIHVLHVFYMASGLKININKSNLFGMGSNMNRAASWKVLIDRFKNKLSASFDKGGLGVGGVKAFNISLIYKWRWRMMKNPEALWVKVIKSIHGAKAGMDSNGCQTNGLWAEIVGTILTIACSHLWPQAPDDSKERAFVIFAASCWFLWRFRNCVTFCSQSMRKCLHIAFKRASELNTFTGFRIGAGVTEGSHFFYADDVVFLCDWCVENVEQLAEVIGCGPSKIPFNYLGYSDGREVAYWLGCHFSSKGAERWCRDLTMGGYFCLDSGIRDFSSA
uniref:RNA-directed DNA polymerase, eukaryota, reverse transcriptase zinc-binding domain protein n=1 Tax=Tanacetum cinerariifolium TaxID=118510 RepID=A0A6L2M5R1_TANCI|nr:RNA-directed DNA polymerase, eukaryota, reverse transcriptase zinc-binding domain protein [Tanacetum cinerariifolium]